MAGEKHVPCTRPTTHSTTAQSTYVVHDKPRKKAKAPPHMDGSEKKKNVHVHPFSSVREKGPFKAPETQNAVPK